MVNIIVYGFTNRDERINYYDTIKKNLDIYTAAKNKSTICYKRKVINGIVNTYLIDMKTGLPKFLVITRLGEKNSDSLDAEAYSVCFPLLKDSATKTYVCDENSINIAIKIIPLTLDEYNARNDIQHGHYPKLHAKKGTMPKHNTWKELYILEQCSDLVRKNIGYNIPMMYGYFICNKANKKDYNNANIKAYYNNQKIIEDMTKEIAKMEGLLAEMRGIKIFSHVKKNLAEAIKKQKAIIDNMEKNKYFYGKYNLIILNELAFLDIKQYFKKHLVFTGPTALESINFVYSSLQQIFVGLYTINKYLGCVHMDLHKGNVLIHEIKEDGFYRYIIDKHDYYIYYRKYLIKIWDFGRSLLLTKDPALMMEKILRDFYNRFFPSFYDEHKDIIHKNSRNHRYHQYLYAIDTWRILNAYYVDLKAIYPHGVRKDLRRTYSKLLKKIKNLMSLALDDITEKMIEQSPSREAQANPKKILETLRLRVHKVDRSFTLNEKNPIII
jgi:hypothetical protein